MKRFLFLTLAALVLLFVQSAFAQTEELPDTVWTKFTYPAEVRAVKFTPDGRYLATGGSDAIPKLWDVETGELVKEFPGRPMGIWDISIAGNMIAFIGAGEGGIQIYDLQNYNLIKTLDGSLNGCFTSDGNYFLNEGDLTVDGISVIDTKNWEVVKSITFGKATKELSISPDNKYVARSSNWAEVNGNVEGEISIYTIPYLKHITTLEKKDYLYCPDLAFSLSNEHLAGALSDTPNKVWNTTDWELFRNLGIGTDARAVAFSPDSKYVVTGYIIGGIYLARLFIFDKETAIEKYSYLLDYFKDSLFKKNGLLAYSIDVNKSADKIAVGTGAGICMLNAKWNPTSVSETPVQITEPLIFPNPASQTVNIRFNLITPNVVSIKVYDINSNMVANVYEGFLEHGIQNFDWNTSRVTSGAYFTHITASGHTSTVKIIVNK